MKHLICLLMIAGLTVHCQAQEREPIRILVFSKTAGFRHESISSGIKMLYDQSHKQQWIITATEDAEFFRDDLLESIDVAVFLNPSGNSLNEEQQAAFERFIRKGRGFVGIHSSADFEYDWAWYGGLNGAHFKMHPPAQVGTVIFEDTSHPAMKPFAGKETYTTFDEWYVFRENPRKNVKVLARLDENSLKQPGDDPWKTGDHPLIWWHEFEGSRSFYTGFGHTHDAFRDSLIMEHIAGAINWAGKRD